MLLLPCNRTNSLFSYIVAQTIGFGESGIRADEIQYDSHYDYDYDYGY